MRITEFTKTFANEQQCKNLFRNFREKAGVECKKCKSTEKQYWLEAKSQWQCGKCKFRTTLKSGTIMEDSKLSFTTWLTAIAFMSFSKKGISAKELQRQLNKKHYRSTWLLMHKIRESMGNRDANYTLVGAVELDDAYITVETMDSEKIKQKRGRGSVTKEQITVMAESTPLEDIETGDESRHVGYYKMKVTATQEAKQVDDIVKENLDEKTIVFSDQSTSYTNIADHVEAHFTEKSSAETTRTTLKWVHTAIGNAKRTFNGVYHKIKGKYLQNYLDEFCYKLNRRYFGQNLFYRVVVAVTQKLVVY